MTWQRSTQAMKYWEQTEVCNEFTICLDLTGEFPGDLKKLQLKFENRSADGSKNLQAIKDPNYGLENQQIDFWKYLTRGLKRKFPHRSETSHAFSLSAWLKLQGFFFFKRPYARP